MKRYVNIDDNGQEDLYCDNRLSNRKYTILNFIPKNLWEQFRWLLITLSGFTYCIFNIVNYLLGFTYCLFNIVNYQSHSDNNPLKVKISWK